MVPDGLLFQFPCRRYRSTAGPGPWGIATVSAGGWFVDNENCPKESELQPYRQDRSRDKSVSCRAVRSRPERPAGHGHDHPPHLPAPIFVLAGAANPPPGPNDGTILLQVGPSIRSATRSYGWPLLEGGASGTVLFHRGGTCLAAMNVCQTQAFLVNMPFSP